MALYELDFIVDFYIDAVMRTFISNANNTAVWRELGGTRKPRTNEFVVNNIIASKSELVACADTYSDRRG